MNSRVALITFLDGGLAPVDPGFGQPAPGEPPAHPWLPGHLGGPRPDQGLPSPGYPSGQPIPVPPIAVPRGPVAGQLPSMPPIGPDNTLPDSEGPPTVSLPIYLPEPPPRDRKFELKYSYRYGWVLVPVKDGAQPK